MQSSVVRRLILLGAMLALPALAFAQEATLTGTITDSTGGVLPGVTVVAVNEASGNQFESVTDARGVYRIPARVGTYRITAQLTGFSTVNRTGVNLLVGQTATVNVQMAPSTLQETVTVTGEAPLIETTTSKLGGNIDPKQVQELPGPGRNWMALALLAPGSRTSSTNATAPLPDRNGGERVNSSSIWTASRSGSELGAGNQPRFSQDSIAEFQFITNQFDATQGRSTGVQVNAITKSGTNQFSGCSAAISRAAASTPRIPSRTESCPSASSSTAPRSAAPSQGQAALLRQLRVRAAARDKRLDDAVPEVQHRALRQEHAASAGHPPRLSAVVEDAHHGQGVGAAQLRSVWRRLLDDAIRPRRSTTTSGTRNTSGSSRRC